MSDAPQQIQDTEEVREGDVLFDCPFCGKNMAIEAAGAGLMVPCATCGRKVQVPIPDQETPDAPVVSGVPDGDANSGDLIQQLDSALGMSNKQIDHLVEEKEALQERRSYLEQMRTANTARLKDLATELETMQNAMDNALVLLAEIRAEKPV